MIELSACKCSPRRPLPHRCARSELQLTSYTLEHVAAKVLNERVPLFSHKTLTGWWTAKDDVGGAVAGGAVAGAAVAGAAVAGGAVMGAPLARPVGALRRDDARVRVLRHFGRRASLTLQIADAMETIARTSELARVFGIDFHSVITRGSQYRVESMMLRLCRTQDYVLASPDKKQVITTDYH